MDKYDMPDDHFDYVVLGTDLNEQIISYLLSKGETKVMNLDKCSTYSGLIQSFNLKEYISWIQGVNSIKDIDIIEHCENTI